MAPVARFVSEFRKILLLSAPGAALLLLPLLAGCAAGGDTFSAAEPAGFWAGLWHGLILAIAFVISLFTDSVAVYEAANTGGWYDFGYVLGACIFFGGTGGSKHVGSRARRKREEQQWEEFCGKAEQHIRANVKSWLDEMDEQDREEWKEIGAKIEEKIKRELRNWASR